jgi:hypothetical protein
MRAVLRMEDAGTTEFTLGMDRRNDHHSGNSLRASPCLCRLPNSLPSRRTLAKYSRPAFWTSRRSVCINPHLAKLIVRTVRFGPADPFFPAYVVFIEETNSRSEGRCSRVIRL